MSGHNAISNFKPKIEYLCGNKIIVTKREKIFLNCDFIDGSVLNGVREPTLYTFTSDRPPSFRVCSDPETILYIKLKNFLLKEKSFSSEDDYRKIIHFNCEPIFFALLLIKI